MSSRSGRVREGLQRILAGSSPGAGDALIAAARALAADAFERGSAEALRETHLSLYLLNTAQLRAPWGDSTANLRQPLLAGIRHELDEGWHRQVSGRYQAELASCPPPPAFEDWMIERIQRHPANVQHRLFDFLASQASFAQLREFCRQETPLEMFFGDFIASMLVGFAEPARGELARNLWDELGRGIAGEAHRDMRIRMLERLGLDPTAHLGQPERYATSELALVNTYFDSIYNRHRLFEAVGILFATEWMVPGRLQRQIDGWRRAGAKEELLEFCLIHISVDPGHASGWLEQAVRPIVAARPEARLVIARGVFRRLDAALGVCDEMAELLPAFRE